MTERTGRPSAKDPRSELVQIPLTKAEREHLEHEPQRKHTTLSELVRRQPLQEQHE
jgi:hypothetical protein